MIANLSPSVEWDGGDVALAFRVTPRRDWMMRSRESASRQSSMVGESMHMAWPTVRWRSDERLQICGFVRKSEKHNFVKSG